MNIIDPTPEEASDWTQWVASRPPRVRDAIDSKSFAPWKLYRLKSSGHRVLIHSFDEPEDDTLPVTARVDVLGRFNAVLMERRVFGVLPEDLEECDLPAADEVLGSLGMDPKDARLFLAGAVGANERTVAEARLRARRPS